MEREDGREGWGNSEWEGKGEEGGGRWGEGDRDGERGGDKKLSF